MSQGGFCGCLRENGNAQDVIAILERMGAAGGGLVNAPSLSQGTGLGYVGTDETGRRQVLVEEGPFAVAFAGELFNVGSLQEQLGRNIASARPNNDALLALRCYAKWGKDCFVRFEGAFSIAILDKRDGSLCVARDRFGQKPLYYYQDEQGLLFASSLRPLLDSGLIDRAIDQQALAQYFQLTYIPAPLTIYQGVRKLMPATWLNISAQGQVHSEKYWMLELGDHQLLDDHVAIKRMLRDEVHAAVERRLPWDQEAGCFLSGGIDSSLVSALAAGISKRRIHTFTIGYKEKKFDERDLAQLVAQRYHTEHHVLLLDEEKALASVEAIFDVMEEPYADSSLIAAHALSEFAKPYVSHVLTGDAGDELFAGYSKYLIDYYASMYRKLPGFVRSGLVEPAVRLLPADSVLARKAGKVVQNAHRDIFEQRSQLMCLGFGQRELADLLLDSAGLDGSLDFMRPYYNAFEDVADEITRAQYLDLNVVLEGDMFPKAQLSARATGLATRPPLIDSAVVALAYRIPSAYKIRRNKLKLILKESFADLLPDELLHAPKRGFAVPMEAWLRGAMRPLLGKLTGEDLLREQGIFRPSPLRDAMDEHFSGRRNRFSELWTVFVFQRWYKRWMS